MKVLVNFRVEPEELEAFKVCAGEQGQTLSDWLRFLANAAVSNSRLDGLSLTNNAIGVMQEPEPPSSVVPKGDWSDVEDPAPSGTPSPAVTESPSPPALEAPPAPTKSSGTPSPVLTGTAKAATVYASERPRAKKARTGFCVHRRRVDEFCPRCD